MEIFAVLPAGSSGPEGIEVGSDGKVYVTTFGFTSAGVASGEVSSSSSMLEAGCCGRFRSRDPAPTCLGSASIPTALSSSLTSAAVMFST